VERALSGGRDPPLQGPRLGRGVGSADRCRDFLPIQALRTRCTMAATPHNNY